MTELFGDAHVQRYQETDGEEGYLWRDNIPTLLLTTVGRKSGAERTSALIFQDWDGRQLIIASKGGSDAPPAWFLNLSDHPEVKVQIKGDKFTAQARVATPEEKPAMWKKMAEIWPDYDNYQTKTDREIPVVVLEH